MTSKKRKRTTERGHTLGGRRGRMSPGFVAVIVFKFLKGVAFVILGVAALKLSRAKEMPTAVEIARFVGVSKENELINRLADVIQTVTPEQATAAGFASIFVGLVFFAEGGLLAARVWWATYFTIALTALGVPLEVYEIFHKPESIRRYVLLAVNLATLLFLWTRRNEFRQEKDSKAKRAA